MGLSHVQREIQFQQMEWPRLRPEGGSVPRGTFLDLQEGQWEWSDSGKGNQRQRNEGVAGATVWAEEEEGKSKAA